MIAKPATEKKKRASFSLWKMPLRHKVGALIVCIIGLMLAWGGASIAVVTYSTRSMQAILNDNQISYNLQQAIAAETRAFTALVRSESTENRRQYQAAITHTQLCLDALPYDYAKTGEKRFEITWTIRNSYAEYATWRDRVLRMNPEDAGYIRTLYQVYSMQDYLGQYCSDLTEIVLQEGNASYAAKMSFFISMPYLLIGISAAVLILLLVALYSTMGDVFRTLGSLAQASREIEQNVFTAPDLRWERQDEMGQMVRAFNKMKHANEEYVQATEEKRAMKEELHRQALARMELEKRFSSAQLQLIKNQINPHFLFNALNTIARMAEIEGAPVSEQMTVAVSNLLRYNLRTTDLFVPLTQELKVVEDYMYIQQMRFGDRVRYRVDCSVDPAATWVPVFLLQPLVENAVLHGIAGEENGGKICVCVRRCGGRLRIAVTDTGVGMNAAQLARVRTAMAQGGTDAGIGLGNLCRRISGFYEDGSVQIYSREGSGTAVLIAFETMKKEWT